MQEAEDTPGLKAAVDAKIPLRGHVATSEIAALFAFLASDEAPYITRHPVIIDGGEIAECQAPANGFWPPGPAAGALLRLRKARSDGDAMTWAHIAWHRDDEFARWARDLPAFRQIVGAR